MPELQSNNAIRPNPAESNAPVAGQSDPLAKLYHMSTTAGVGTQEYVAINPVAIVALLLGFASVLVILSGVLLIVPVAAATCGIIALIQIRRSNQTQTGTWLAAGGLLLALLLGAGRAASDLVTTTRHRADQQQLASLLRSLGDDLAAGRYDEAYKLFDDRFRERVTYTTFETAFAGFKDVPHVGALRSVQWNNEPMEFRDSEGVTIAVGMGIFGFQDQADPSRMLVQFQKSDSQWQIDNIPNIFPPKKE